MNASSVPRRFELALMVLALILAAAPRRAAAQLGPTPGPTIVSENTGEATRPLANYWEGVDSENNLHVNTMGFPVLNDVGDMVDTAIPAYPNFADMNGDGLKDLVVGDAQGFIWIYLNSGKKGAPKFTAGAFLPTFTGWASKINVYDWDDNGVNDIVIGTFHGDVVILKNLGNRMEYRFTRRMGVPRYHAASEDPHDALPQLMIGKKVMIKGNYLAPWVCDWNKDGRQDLILGEGTYSANSKRLYINAGSRNKPVFSDEKEFYLAFGEGFEQLVPAVVDYNGDGLDDLIAGTRTGQIRLHKGTKKAVESKDFVAAARGTLAPAILEYEGNLKIADKEIFTPMSAPYPCDWNEDGLFDLLLGSPQGNIYIAINKGTKTAPQFPAAEPVKGTDVARDLLAPANYGVYYNRDGDCNSAFLLTCEKGLVLAPGLAPLKPVEGNYFVYFRYVAPYSEKKINEVYPGWIGGARGARAIHGPSFTLHIGKRYEFSFSAVLVGNPVSWSLSASELVAPATDEHPEVYEGRSVSNIIPPSKGWIQRKYTFKCPSTINTNLNYGLTFNTGEGECQFCWDGMSMKELAGN